MGVGEVRILKLSQKPKSRDKCDDELLSGRVSGLTRWRGWIFGQLGPLLCLHSILGPCPFFFSFFLGDFDRQIHC